ncbi:MAG: TonB-dependent receptor [Rikenellaceae bacterium]
MKKITLIIILILAQLTSALALTKNNQIKGHIIDANTNEHIAHATVIIEGTTIATVSDNKGHFILQGVPKGEFTILVSMLGYNSTQKEVSLKKESEQLEMTFTLKEDALLTDQVVVSSSRTETKRKNSSSLVSIMTGDLYKNIGAPTLVDGLSFQPSVRVEDNCQNCGFTQVRINGLDGHYSQILIDSRPLFSALTGVYGLEQIPANMIDRVEVVRGGGSALFGSSAIGGTINIITKTPEYNSAEIAHSTTILEGGSLDNNTTANMSFRSDNQRAGATIFAQLRDRDYYDANGDGYSEIAELESSTLGIRTFLKTGNYSKLSFQYDHTSEYRRGGNDFDLQAHKADVAEMVDHNINSGGVNFDLFSKNHDRKLNIYSSIQSTVRDSYYGVNEGEEDEIEEYGQTNELTLVSGAQLTQSWENLWFMPVEFVAGIEYYYNDLEDEAIELEHYLSQKVHTTSMYAQNEWKNDKYGFLVGVRADKNSLLDKVVFSPRVNFRYNPSDKINFRATYSTGFRAPQAFDEDLHIAIVGGERVVTQLAEDLKEEESQSFTLSADMYHNFGNVSANLLVEGFYTNLKDAYAIRITDQVNSDGSTIQERYNGSGATVKGITAEARLTLPNIISFQAAMTYQKSLYQEAEEWSDGQFTDEMFRSPDLYGYLTASYNINKDLILSASGTYTGTMLVQHCEGSGSDSDIAVYTPDFFDANIKLSYYFTLVGSIRMEVYAGVQNIFNSYQTDFDSGFERDPGYIYGPIMPRRYNLGTRLTF